MIARKAINKLAARRAAAEVSLKISLVDQTECPAIGSNAHERGTNVI